jgi:L-asparaginase/Glu-tRNA(Gln) amidotransferase subunit D
MSALRSPSDAETARTLRVLGTGGTIAGTAAAGAPDNAYRAAQVAVQGCSSPCGPGWVGTSSGCRRFKWPRVEIMHSHAGADGRVLLALLADASVQGEGISATGNGSIHDALHQALLLSVQQGRLARTQILVSSRCTAGWVVGDPEHGWPVAHRLSPALTGSSAGGPDAAAGV